MKSHGIPKYFLAMLLVWAGFSVSALSPFDVPQYRSRLWQTEDGLPDDVVRAIVQTRDGYLWVGTTEGLARFDGMHFHPIDFPNLQHVAVTALCESPDGSLWIGTEKSGLFRLHDGKFMRYTKADGLDDGPIRLLHQSKGGALWIALTWGAMRYGNDHTFTKEPLLSHNQISSICDDDGDGIWFAYHEGVKHLQHGVVTALTNEFMAGQFTGRAVYQTRSGTLLAGVVNGLVQTKEGVATYHSIGPGRKGSVSAFQEDRDGTIWVGSQAGLSRFIEGEFLEESEGSRSYFIYALCEDAEGNLWVGSDEGLRRYTRNRFQSYTKQQGLNYDSTTSVCEGTDGSIWFGTWGGGINRLKNGTITTLTKMDGLSTDLVASLFPGKNGSVWVGLDYDGGLNHLENGAIATFGKDEGLAYGGVSALLENKRGDVWVGSRTGLNFLHEGKFVHYSAKDQDGFHRVNAIAEAHDGTVWVGMDDVLMRFDGGEFRYTPVTEWRLHSLIYSIYEDAEHCLWIGTKGGGLKCWRDGDIDTLTTKQGLPSDTINSILEDNNGNLWMAGSRGIFRVNKNDLKRARTGEIQSVNPVSYGKLDGIISSSQYADAYQPASWKSADGRLWFRTTLGVVVTDPKMALEKNEIPPPTVIEAILADKKGVEGGGWKTENGKASAPSSLLDPPSSIPIAPGRGEVEFHYTALSFRGPEKNQFKYKLDGVDSDWVDAGTRRVAYYNNLDPGDYTFRVMAANNDGVWNTNSASVRLTLLPHFTQTKWFIGLIIMASVGLVAGAARYLTWKRVQQELRRIEQQNALEKERARIAQDMHDDLGARLTEILLLNNAAKKSVTLEQAEMGMAKVSGVAREVIDNLDALVWTVNPRNDSLAKLASYICEYAGSFLKLAAIPCRFELLENVPEIPLSSEVRHNVFLVLKEALNNVVKYSGATEVWVRLQLRDSTLAIAIEDNGKGFRMADAAPRGNGLSNMQKRMHSIGGCFEVVSEPGKGTRIRLQIPI